MALIHRLRERGVLRVAASYAVIAWLVLQIADVVLEPWDVALWVKRAPLVIALLGFPIALVLAWCLELGDRGVAVDAAPAGASRPVVHGIRRYADVAIISVLAAIVGFFVLREAGWLGRGFQRGPAVESSSLAVMPFVNVGVVADSYLSEGLADELRNQFSRMQSLSVTARSSSMAFEDQSLDAVTIATRLAVAALLEGTVRREAGRLHVSVQLVDGGDGKVLWAERYDRPDRDLLAVQREIAGAVVAAVLPRFAASGQSVPPPPTDDPVAYDLYLLGRQYAQEADSMDDLEGYPAAMPIATRAIDAFRSAIEVDPEFAAAHARMARMLMYPEEPDKQVLAARYDRDVLPHIRKALELDPDNAYAHFVKGLVLRTTQRPGGSAAYRRAYELDPNDPDVLRALAASVTTSARFDERARLLLLARDRDPMTWQRHMSAIQGASLIGRRDEVRAAVERMQAQFPGDPVTTAFVCRAHWLNGEPDEMLACATRWQADHPADDRVRYRARYHMGNAWEAMGDAAQALAHYDAAAVSGEEEFALEVIRLRRDRAALGRMARETLAREISINDFRIADLLLRGGLHDEALEIFRRGGMASLAHIDSNQLPDAMVGFAQMILLLRERGESAEAERLLPDLLAYSEAALEHGARWFWFHLLRAQALTLAGRTDEAFEQVGKAIDGYGSPFAEDWITGDSVLGALAHDARFEAHLERLRQRQAEARARLPEAFHRNGLAWPPS